MLWKNEEHVLALQRHMLGNEDLAGTRSGPSLHTVKGNRGICPATPQWEGGQGSLSQTILPQLLICVLEVHA